MVQWYNAGLEIQRFLTSNPDVAKKKISHRSNQNNTTSNPFAPELNS